MSDINERIRAKLLELQDLKYKEFHSNLCNTCKYEMIGVRVPELRKFAKELVKEEFRDFLENRDIKYYEEALLKGLVIGCAKLSFEETCKQLKKFVPIIDNWAVCDITCSSLKITKKYMNEMWDFLKKYIISDKQYEIRFAVVMYLSYYINKNYLKDIFEMIEKVNNEDYYTKMAIAWFISIAYIKEKNMTLKFLKNTNIDDWTYNKALQKIIESYRVDELEKIEIKHMKR